MEIIGYKCFNKDLTNRYGKKFELGKIYIAQGDLKSNGFHICKNMEDTLRYFDAVNDEISICEVKGSGDRILKEDEYYGYYEMYIVEKLEILKLLSREDIIKKMLKSNEFSVERFLTLFKLTNEEILLFKEKYKGSFKILDTISYYQEKNLDTYEKKLTKKW